MCSITPTGACEQDCRKVDLGQRPSSDTPALMGSAAASHAAIGEIADQEKQEIKNPLPPGTLRITRAFSTEKHDTCSSFGPCTASKVASVQRKLPTDSLKTCKPRSLDFSVARLPQRVHGSECIVSQQIAAAISGRREQGRSPQASHLAWRTHDTSLGSASKTEAILTNGTAEWVKPDQVHQEISPAMTVDPFGPG